MERNYIRDVELISFFHFPFPDCPWLYYEALVGDKAGLESVRVNDRFRIEFTTTKVVFEIVITVCIIIELSNHYK